MKNLKTAGLAGAQEVVGGAGGWRGSSERSHPHCDGVFRTDPTRAKEKGVEHQNDTGRPAF